MQLIDKEDNGTEQENSEVPEQTIIKEAIENERESH